MERKNFKKETVVLFADFSSLRLPEKVEQMANTEIKFYSLAEMKDKYIGKVGTTERDEYEYELRMDIFGRMIKTARIECNLINSQLWNLNSQNMP